MSKVSTRAAVERRAGLARAAARDPAFTLRLLREALDLTQVELAERTGISQSELSKIERRADAHVSTLAKYAAGLGGTLELRVVVGGRPYRLELADERPSR